MALECGIIVFFFFFLPKKCFLGAYIAALLLLLFFICRSFETEVVVEILKVFRLSYTYTLYMKTGEGGRLEYME
jgi:hypothetical protein